MTTFGELVARGVLAVGDGYRAKNEELGDEGPIFLRSGYLQDNGWQLNEPDRLERPANGFGPKVALLYDTVLTTKGNSLGRLGLVNSAVAGAVYSPHLSYWRSLRHDELSPRYLYYWACSAAAQSQIKARSESTDMAPYLSLADQLALKIEVPNINQQRAIAGLLGSLDDKIDLNVSMAETLSAIARALFRSWFVDFDPVHAKEEGRSTGLPEDMASLFPDSFGKDGLPMGWQRCKLSSILTVTKGNSYKSVDLAPSRTALVTLKSFKRGGGYRPDGLKPFKGPYKESQIVRPGELIVAGTDVTQAAEVIGQPALVQADAQYEVLVASLDTFILRGEAHAPWLWELFLSEQGFPSFARGYTTGTTVLHLSARVFDDFSFVMPGAPTIIHRAEQALADIYARITGLSDQSYILASLRDSLLPKLISGELSTKEYDKKVSIA